jgi:hypothetical protein
MTIGVALHSQETDGSKKIIWVNAAYVESWRALVSSAAPHTNEVQHLSFGPLTSNNQSAKLFVVYNEYHISPWYAIARKSESGVRSVES